MNGHKTPYDRRTVLRAAGTAAFAGVLAGCTEEEDEEPEDEPEDEPEEEEDEEDEEPEDEPEEDEAELLDEEEEPDYGDFMDDVPNYEGTYDYRGEEEVEVLVGAGDGGLEFEPAAIMVDPGTTVVWEWTGEGGAHDVVSQEGEELESELVDEEGHTYEHTFEEPGETLYVCTPHEAQGKKGAVAVDGEEEAEDEEEPEDGEEPEDEETEDGEPEDEDEEPETDEDAENGDEEE
jgi:halocyanin-like protein